MSIPLDCQYYFIENIAKKINDNIIIYRFYPHGSKKIENLEEISGPLSWKEMALRIPIYCHDQEPLNYKLYQNVTDADFINIIKSMCIDRNLMRQPTIYNKVCLLHSEKRSTNLITYQAHQCVGIYYWSHALMSLDWFRFARHITQKKHVQKIFLIYNRAWSGTREYRLKFTDLLITSDLQKKCHTSVNSVEPELGIHYDQHQFNNPVWRPAHVLENYFSINTSPSHYSADFNITDYEDTDIEVVLETLFDDERLHLTEKSLRPIACAQPFILAATYGSLEYLRSYGFQTFGDIWDENYDTIENSAERLIAITDLMKTISCWTPEERIANLTKAKIIADYNRNHFFSKEFFNQITAELKTNLTIGLNQITSEFDPTPFVERWKKFLTHKEIKNYLESQHNLTSATLDQIDDVLQIAKDLQNKRKN